MQSREDINHKFRIAAAQGNLDLCIELSAHLGFDVNAKGLSTGRTALHQAVLFNRPKIVEFLLSLDRIQSLKDKEDKTPFDCARAIDSFDIIRLLIDKFPEFSPEMPSTDLCHSLGDELMSIIEEQASVLSFDDCLKLSELVPPGSRYMGCSLLYHIALNSSNWQAMKWLMLHGEDPNSQVAEYQRTSYRNTIVHLFLANEDAGAITFIDLAQETGKKIDFTIQDEQGKTVVFLAAKIRRPVLVEALIARGAASSLGITDNNGYNILHVACLLGDVKTLKMLQMQPIFKELADQTNHFGQLPEELLDLPVKETKIFIKSIFINPERDFNAPFNLATKNTFTPANKTFLEVCLDGRKEILEHLKNNKVNRP